MSDTISCPQCSSPLQAGAVFCTSCGHRLEASADSAPDAAPPAPSTPSTPSEDATRVDTPGLNDTTQAFATPPAAPQPGGESAAPQPGGGHGAAPGAPWQPADAGTPGAPGPATWNPPPQAPHAAPQAPQGQPQAWQQPQPGAPQPPGAPHAGAAPQGWTDPNQGAPAPWDTTGTAPTSTATKSTSLLGGLVALIGGALTLAGIFTAWFELSSSGLSETITGWELASGDKGLESNDPYILLALGIVALAVGVLLFMGQMRLMVRIAAVIVGIAIIGVTVNDWMTTASLIEDDFPSSVKLSGAIGFYLTIAGGIVTAAAAALPAKK